MSSTDDQQGDQPSIAGNRPKVAVIPVKEDTNSSGSVVSISTIDTSGVKLRKKSKRSKQSETVPYVVPRFDDMEEDSVKVRFVTNHYDNQQSSTNINHNQLSSIIVCQSINHQSS